MSEGIKQNKSVPADIAIRNVAFSDTSNFSLK